MFNKIIMVGNLSRDIEMKQLPSGTVMVNTAIATNRKFKNKKGETTEEVCFVDISIFGRTAEIANKYLKRGSKILIEGRLKLEQWTNQNGEKRSKHVVVVDSLQMLDSKSVDTSISSNTTHQKPKQEAKLPDIDEEIPF